MIKTENIEYTAKDGTKGIIRPGKPEEAREIMEIEKSAFGRLNTSESKIKKEIENPDKYVWLVAEQNGRLVGFQGIELKNKHTFRLIGLGVWKDLRGQWIGQALFTSPDKIAKLNNVDQIYFEVRQSNPAQKIYFKCGYLVTDFKHLYYSHPIEGAVIMTKTIK